MNASPIFTCPVCHHNLLQTELACTDYLVSNQTFSLLSCSQCSLWVTAPAPPAEALSTYYPSAHYVSHQKKSSSFFDSVYFVARAWMLKRKMAMIERYKRKGALLDYGCGTGAFVKVAQQNGWDATGYEPSENARKNADPGVTIVSTTQQLNKPYQVITLWHVLEHLPELQADLVRIVSTLAPNGLLVIAVPNRLSLDARHYGPHWAAYDVPRHLWHFTPQAMEKLLTQHGLKLVARKPLWLDAYYVSLLSEKYRGASTLIAWVNALLTGTRSNLSAWLGNGQFSSLIYIARK